MSEAWVPDEVWQQVPGADAIHYTLVYDPELGALAEATHPDGTHTYGTDQVGQLEEEWNWFPPWSW